MKRLVVLFMLVLSIVVLLVACGGGSGEGGSTPAHAAVISNLQYSPQSASQSTTPVTVTGSIYFTDAGGDISTLTGTIYDSNGTQLDSHTGPITGGSGHTSGTVHLSSTMDVSVKGVYTFKIYVTDSTGAPSNVLTATFTVT
jgi:hypothetical protein